MLRVRPTRDSPMDTVPEIIIRENACFPLLNAGKGTAGTGMQAGLPRGTESAGTPVHVTAIPIHPEGILLHREKNMLLKENLLRLSVPGAADGRAGTTRHGRWIDSSKVTSV